MAENTIDNLSIQVTASADNAARVFDRLASSAGRLRGAAQGAAGGMEEMADGAMDAGTVTSTTGKMAEQAQPKIRGIGNDAKTAGDKAKKGAAGIATFWNALKRIAYYRFIRSVIKEITSAFSEGIKNLYHWSDLINGHFAASMDRLATSSQYLKNSLGAMVSPLIETLVPVLDVIIDKVVDVLNFFNMLVSAVSGADTYTVAKKAAAVWDDSANRTSRSARQTANELKRTILGFDEINKLVKQTSPSGNGSGSNGKKQPDYGAMFEEKPLTGIFKKISDITSGWPDWLKALLGVGAFALPIFGIPALLKKIWDGLKKLFTIGIPDWFRWLFGPKGDGDGGINIPDEIKLPDAELPVDLVKDDWSVLDGLHDNSVLVPVGLRRWGWDNLPDWIGTAVTTAVGLKKWGWTSLEDWAGANNGIIVKVALSHWGWDNLPDWIGRAVTIAVALKKWGWSSLEDWIGTNNGLLVQIGLRHWGWTTISDYIGTAVTVMVGLKKWGWKTLEEWTGAINGLLVKVGLSHWGWSNIEDWIGRAVTVRVALQRWGWTTLGDWTRADAGLFVNIGLKHCGWTTISDYIGTVVTVLVGLKKWGWDTLSNWTGANNGLLVNVGLKHWGWNTISEFIGTAVTVMVGLNRWNWSNLETWIGDRVNVLVNLERGNFWNIQDFVGDRIYASVNLYNGNYWNLESFVGSWIDVSVYLVRGNFWSLESWVGNQITVRVNLQMGSGGIITVNGVNRFNNNGGGGSFLGGGAGRSRKLGGIFANGLWNSIPQYAGGTSNAHGTMFIAGEAGPEIVGHVGGRTEVLNKSQIASAMYSAVQAAMAPAAANFAAAAQSMGVAETGFDIETLAEMVRQGVEQAMSRSNDYDRQKVDLLRQINGKEFTAEVTARQINKSQTYANRRAGTTVVAVGT